MSRHKSHRLTGAPPLSGSRSCPPLLLPPVLASQACAVPRTATITPSLPIPSRSSPRSEMLAAFFCVLLVTLQSLPSSAATSSSSSSSTTSTFSNDAIPRLEMNVTLYCNYTSYHECRRALADQEFLDTFVNSSCPLALRLTGFHPIEGAVLSRLDTLWTEVRGDHAQFLVAIGPRSNVQVLALVAKGLDIPVLAYTPRDDSTEPLFPESYVSLNAARYHQGKAMGHVIGEYNLGQSVALVEERLLADGFLDGFHSRRPRPEWQRMAVKALPRDMTEEDLIFLLTEVSIRGWKIIVVHSGAAMTVKVLYRAQILGLVGTGYAWFLSEQAMVEEQELLSQLPQGLMALQSFLPAGTQGTLHFAADVIHRSCLCSQRLARPAQDAFSFEDFLANSSSDWSLAALSNSSWLPSDGEFYGMPNSTEELYANILSVLSRPSRCHSAVQGNVTSEGMDPWPWGETHAFHLLNLVDSGPAGERHWISVGNILPDGRDDLKTLLWPGRTIFGPGSNSEKTYRVVTHPAEPFVFAEGPVDHPEQCYTDTPCIKMTNTSAKWVAMVIEDFLTSRDMAGTGYEVYCCKGLTLDLLQRLALDLNFRYVVYFTGDGDYGAYRNGSWTGLIGDIVQDAADIIAGAFSITSERMTAIGFTEPYYHNEFTMVTSAVGRSTSMWAFLSPFSYYVWMCIVLSSIAAGIATSVLEWCSPFGLNPRGRKRQRKYTLGSGLLMVWVLVTGHTINVKAPKGWPSKVIQNVWAGLAIFIMTSYTANLAAYLAGQTTVIVITSIFDPKLLTRRLSWMKSTAVEALIDRIRPELMKHHQDLKITTPQDAILKLMRQEFDVYLEDSPLVEYAVTRLDPNCSVSLVGKGFGSDGYALGLPKFSWLQVPLSNRIMWYSDTGYIHDLARKYMARPKCGTFLASSAVQYSLEHTGGLFIILLSAMLLSVLLLLGEHVFYKYAVPWIRAKPQTSFWKSENLSFFSQRLYRVVRSEKLYSQKQAAQEMIKIVKERDFTRLLQKNELQKRKIPKRKQKTKTEMFQDITSNIISFNRQLRTAVLEDGFLDSSRSTVDLDDISLEGQLEDDLSLQPHLEDRNGEVRLPGQHPGVANHAYHRDGDSRLDVGAGLDEGAEPDEDYGEELEGETSFQLRAVTELSPVRERALFQRRLTPLFSTLSAPVSQIASAGSSSSPRRHSTAVSASPSASASVSESAPVSQCASPTSDAPEGSAAANNNIWCISDGRVPEGETRDAGVVTRKLSDIGPVRSNLSDMRNNIRRTLSHDYQHGDYFQRNLPLKDNRVKSTLRRHALSGFQAQLPVDMLDECTVEALSKEDLLILWKKSEIELQSRLKEVLTRNRKLSQAINFLTRAQSEETVAEEV